jgi:winged helix DNA-binding protein
MDGRDSGVAVTARQLNRATLGRQLLLRREKLGVVEAVHRIVAMQAQEPASPYLALWNRLAPFDPAELDRAFADRAIVKGTLLRITLHAVDAADYPAFHRAMQPTLRASRLNDRRFTRTGLSREDSDKLIPEVMRYAARGRTNAEVEAWLDERIGVTPKPGVWWALRQSGPFIHAPAAGPWSFGPRPTYAPARTKPHLGPEEVAVQHLVRRYLEGFGPASAKDAAQFGTILVPPTRAALESLVEAGDAERLAGPGGAVLYDVPGGLRPSEDAAAPPRLMAMWDSALLAYADRSRIIPPDYRKLVMRNNGDVLPSLLVDGLVAGVWRPLDGRIEATAFHRLSKADWAGLAKEADALIAFLAHREPAVYRRYARWWESLPSAEVRVLGG